MAKQRFDLRHAHFQVKLQAHHLVPDRKSLVLAGPAARQMNRAFGQIKSVSVPMENGRALGQNIQRMVPDVRRVELNGEPADFLLGVGVHFGAQDTGDQLRSQADAQHFLLFLNGQFDEELFPLIHLKRESSLAPMGPPMTTSMSRYSILGRGSCA